MCQDKQRIKDSIKKAEETIAQLKQGMENRKKQRETSAQNQKNFEVASPLLSAARAPVPAYASAVRCPVLTYAMLLVITFRRLPLLCDVRC